MMAPVEINDETLALDLIDEIGPDGSFLDSDHTMKHFRERWYPQVFERGNFDQWRDAGGLDLGLRAAQQVDTILKEHQPELLPEDVQQQLRVIVQRAEESFR
jgi:trimethylamine--corrinoid protein Co-methyltransferase